MTLIDVNALIALFDVDTPSTHDIALRLHEATAEPTNTFIGDTLSFTDASRMHTDGLLTTANITYTYLLALAVVHKARFAAFDHGVSLRAVAGATDRHSVKL